MDILKRGNKLVYFETEFDFYDNCILGLDVKVPFIRYDYQCEEWQAVARVFVEG